MPTDFPYDLLAEASQDWELKALLTGATIVAVLLIKWLTVRIIRKRVHDPTIRLVWTQIANGSIGLSLILILSWVWLQGVGSILALLTLVAAAMTIVHKELILNFSAWSIIAWRELFRLGDYVEVGTSVGKVVDIGPMYFTLNESTRLETGTRPTGRTVRIPNSLVLTSAVINYSDQSLRWIELDLAIAYDSDWEEAKRMLEEIVENESSALTSHHHKAGESRVTLSMKDNKILLTAHFPAKPGHRLESQTRVTAKILTELKKAEIKLA